MHEWAKVCTSWLPCNIEDRYACNTTKNQNVIIDPKVPYRL